jgi:hypothetical protein
MPLVYKHVLEHFNAHDLVPDNLVQEAFDYFENSKEVT